MAKNRDKVWYCDGDGQRAASVTRAQTFVNGLLAKDSYDAETVDLALYNEHTDEAGEVHLQIAGGVTAAKLAKTEADQKTAGFWWPKG